MSLRRTGSLYGLVALVIALPVARSPAEEARTWTDSTGKFKIEAEFVRIVEGQVRLKRTDGRELTLPLAKLSKEDQTYLRDLSKRKRAGEGEPTNPFDAGLDASFGEDGIEAHDHEQLFRRGNGDSGPFGNAGDADVAQVDLTGIRRIVLLGDGDGAFKPDPAATGANSWRPRPLGLNAKAGFFEEVTGLSLSAEGGLAAVVHSGGDDPRDSAARIELCDLKAGRVKGVMAAPRGLQMMALSPSGRQVVTVSEVETFTNGPLQLWEIADKQLKHLASWHVSSDADHRDLEWIGWADEQHVMTVDRAGLTAWATNGPEGVYQISGDGLKAPSFSPGRKQFAIGTDKGLSIHDVASGEVLTRIALARPGFARHTAFSPSGKLLAVTGSSTVEIYEGATGKKVTEAYAGSAHRLDQGLCWLDEEHVLVGGSDVIHLPSQMTVWTYQHNADAVVSLAGRVWYLFVGQGDGPSALLPFQLPHEAVKPVRDSELVLKPGDRVSIELELMVDLDTSDGDQVSPDEHLRRALTDAGFLVVDSSDKRLIARTMPGETKEVAYRTFGAPFGQSQKTSYTQRVFELELIVDGVPVWTRQRVVDAPLRLQLEENESIDQAVERVMAADVGFFRSTMPSRVLPTEAERARSSTLTINGLE